MGGGGGRAFSEDNVRNTHSELSYFLKCGLCAREPRFGLNYGSFEQKDHSPPLPHFPSFPFPLPYKTERQRQNSYSRFTRNHRRLKTYTALYCYFCCHTWHSPGCPSSRRDVRRLWQPQDRGKLKAGPVAISLYIYTTHRKTAAKISSMRVTQSCVSLIPFPPPPSPPPPHHYSHHHGTST